MEPSSLLLCALAVIFATINAQTILENNYIAITFNTTSGRIISINSKQYKKEIIFATGDDVGISLNISNKITNIESGASFNQDWIAKFSKINESFAQTIFTSSKYSSFSLIISYELQSEWKWISKQLSIQCNDNTCKSYQVLSYTHLLSEFTASGGSNGAFSSFHSGADNAFGGGREIALFTRFMDNTGFFQMMANPFTTYLWDISSNGSQAAMYEPYEYFKSGQININYITDRLFLGIYKLSKYQIITNINYLKRKYNDRDLNIWKHPDLKMDIVVTTIDPKLNISVEFDDNTYTNIAERDIIIEVVEPFLMDIEDRKKFGSVKINVGWDENDYQLDITNKTLIPHYQRIFQRCNQYGIGHETFGPWNPLQASHQRATDNWGWEPVLWFSEGENIRQLIFNPWTDSVPNELSSLLTYANNVNVHTNAYVYPILGFENNTDWLFNPKTNTMGCTSPNTTQCYASLANVDFQNYLSDLLIQYCELTKCGGYNWDYTFFQDPSYLNQYTQWKGWMRVIGALREYYNNHPNGKYGLVMDHRQLNHEYGIWYQLAGSYAEPLASDENPETYGVAIPKLHTDHIATDFMRRQNYIYYQSQYESSFRVPGFINHQTERGGGPMWSPHFERDFDIIGTIYSTVANVGYAGMNMVFAMIPGRDEEEFTKMPAKAIDFTKYWLNFTDVYGFSYLRYTRPILPIPNSMRDSIDGTSAINSKNMNDTGFIFLYNSWYPNASVSLTLDESIGISNNSMGDTFIITAVYPVMNVIEPMTVKYGEIININNMRGISAMILTVEKTNIKITPKYDPYPMIIPPQAIPPSLPNSTFRSGLFNGEFYIGSDVYKYLENVNNTYPVNWDINQDANISWLMPYRLLMYINILQPVQYAWNAVDLQLKIDNKMVDTALIKKGYNSRVSGQRCFLGFYLDITQDIAKPDVMHTLSLNIPSAWKLYPGQFQGVFFENLEASFFV